jgi:hypothetical protein
MNERTARTALGATSAIATGGLLLQLVLSLTKDGDGLAFPSIAGRIVNFFSYFTVWSNIAVAVTTGLLAVRLDRPSLLFRVARITTVVCISVTGVVFHLALADLQELTGWDRLADFLLHTLVPILAPLGWLLIGPRRQLTRQVVALTPVGPGIWLVYALIRGELVDDAAGNPYYAYPFMNANVHGYAVVAFRLAIVAVAVAVVACGAKAIDRRLPGIDADDGVTVVPLGA